ncbi:MAG TPA: manganese efflux pump [Clostridia bacterium]|jgi:putative Mn2+ efflux pump MntP|nr:manganese efflux pump [Clostridia bacterium]HHY06693.1 manganese efflux pump [Clostridia bacterium]
MNYPAVLLVSVALGVDAFSVAIGIGLGGIKTKEALLVSGVVSIFHVLMPLIGLYLGIYLGSMAGPIASTIGALILLTIGLNMVGDSLREAKLLKQRRRETPGLAYQKGTGFNLKSPLSLILMAGSVSIDALTVGLGLGPLQVDLFLTVMTMGITAGLMTLVGLVFGHGLSKVVGSTAGLCGGIILVVIGLKILIW